MSNNININNPHQETPIPSNNNRRSISRRITSFFSNIYRPTQPPTLSGRAHQIPSEKNPRQALDHWTEVVLDLWVEEGDPKEQRIQAKSAIKAFLSDQANNCLTLSNLQLSTLPDIWEHPAFIERLKNLDLDGNKLRILPASMGQLTALEVLLLQNNEIQEISACLTQLTTLIELNLSNNHICVIPEDLAQLTALEVLLLENNEIQEISACIGQLPDLIALDLANNQIREIPDCLLKLTALKGLLLQNNQIQEIPEYLAQLKDLKVLDLANNQIREIPECLAQLSDLEGLDLSNNSHLTNPPIELLQLSPSCSINIQNCNLSPEFLHQLELEESFRLAGEEIPTIHYTKRNVSSQTVNELLDSFYQIAKRPRVSFSEEFTTHSQLRDWLERIFYIADFNENQGANRSQIANKVIHFIELAADPKHKEFHDAFFGIIHDAAETCGDRMSLSILHLGIAHKLALLDAMETPPIKELANTLLRGTWALSLLEKIAKEKITSILRNRPSFKEEIEVYLGYPIMLKKKLQLPIDVNEMLYFFCSALTEKDLKTAEKSVLQHLNNKEEACAFLASQEIWIKALDKLGLLKKINEEKEKQSAEAERHEDYVAIDTAYKKGLREISAQVLSKYYE